MWYYICLVVGAVIGWAMCAICTVAKCEDCVVNNCKGGYTMNRFKCLACGENQYTACSTAEGCIYCGNKELKKMGTLEPKEDEEMREIKFRRNDSYEFKN